MRQGLRRNWPATAVAVVALFAALGGSVYAAKRRGIDGRAIRVKSLPGNRVRVKSLPGNRLRPHSIPLGGLQPGVLAAARKLTAPLTGAEIDEWTLGQVPRATYAETADTARSAVDAETALNAVDALDAETVNGHSAGCRADSTPFAGACWQTASSEAALTAPQAAIECAKAGGALPEALQLAAFAQQLNKLTADEWSGDLMNFSGPNAYGVVTVSSAAVIDLALSTEKRHYRCVTPVLS
jgi:hypothetical protein